MSPGKLIVGKEWTMNLTQNMTHPSNDDKTPDVYTKVANFLRALFG
jgi:hypothetical protein